MTALNPYAATGTETSPVVHRNLHPIFFRIFTIWTLIHYHVIFLILPEFARNTGRDPVEYLGPPAFLYAVLDAIFWFLWYRHTQQRLHLLTLVLRSATHVVVPFVFAADLPPAFELLDYAGQLAAVVSLFVLPCTRPKLYGMRILAVFSLVAILFSMAANIDPLYQVYFDLPNFLLGALGSVLRILFFWHFRDSDLALPGFPDPK